jgi:E3 SUMO-protein ligase PIAS1
MLTLLNSYVRDILQKTSKDVDQVVIDPSGEWSLSQKTPSKNTSSGQQAPINRGSVVEIDDQPWPASSTSSRMPTQSLSASTGMPYASPHHSSTSTPSNKRPISAVIDLTLSDDEDEQPVRQVKRQHFGQGSIPLPSMPSNSVPNNTYQAPVFGAQGMPNMPYSNHEDHMSPYAPDPFGPYSYYSDDRPTFQ